MVPIELSSRNRGRAGITLTEILIAIFIMGIGLVSLATLFPIGLLRLREAQRQSRSAYLVESAAADAAARGLFNRDSFTYSDLLNQLGPYPFWYLSPLNPDGSGRFNPLTQDTAFYGADPFDPANPGANSQNSGGYGLPFAYDPLWRQQANPRFNAAGQPVSGLYLYDNDPYYSTFPGGIGPEARFGDGHQFLRMETDGSPASANGLQRLTNFNRPNVMFSAFNVPNIFVSPEDYVWQESTKQDYTVAATGALVNTPSTVVPDLSMTFNAAGNPTYQPTNDWRFSWMITAQQNNLSNAASFDGNIVIFENRPFQTDTVSVTPTSTAIQAAGETVVEAVFGFSTNVLVPAGFPGGYGVGADRTVLLRWVASQPDPMVKVGDWIADVTYERNFNLVSTRFIGVPNPLNNLKWDNLPAQRCFWYQVQKVVPAGPDNNTAIAGGPYRSMVVYVNRKLDAKTLLLNDGFGTPVIQNAALVSPHVVNVIPQTFFVR
jgi:type II secretory pathway pseudopilin PulG